MSSPGRLSLLLIAAVAALALAGCSIGDDGPQTSQTRDVAAFTRVDNQDSVDVRLRRGERQRVRVLAGEKVIDDVHTVVRDGTLRVTFDHTGFGGDEVLVEASVPELAGINASGSGDIDATGIDADAFQVRSDGSADITLEGTAGVLALAVDGSGDADVAGLATREARVAATGSGDVDVRADAQLEVEVEGSGDVRYHGDPSVRKHLDGSGDLKRAG
jgi:Putative auto-transporter adhesin, head GIN domain